MGPPPEGLTGEECQALHTCQVADYRHDPMAINGAVNAGTAAMQSFGSVNYDLFVCGNKVVGNAARLGSGASRLQLTLSP